jgi:hypothetical protein
MSTIAPLVAVVDLIHLAQDTVRWRALVEAVINILLVPKMEIVFTT